MKTTKKVGIIGGGPRGLFALEQLIEEASRSGLEDDLNIVIFEPRSQLACSDVYDLDQPATNWINISERAMDIRGREAICLSDIKIPPFPDYHEWKGCSIPEGDSTDTFPPRSLLGLYLKERFESIGEILIQKNIVHHIKDKVDDININDDLIEIVCSSQTSIVDEALIVVGHQATEPAEQMSCWKEHADKFDALHLYESAYPIQNILNDRTNLSGEVIALRGFGLGMIDVMRALTIGLGGKFEVIDYKTRQMTYHESDNQPKAILPFSLDGLPAVPKPLSSRIDNLFKPNHEQLEIFRMSIRAIFYSQDGSLSCLVDKLALISTAIFKRLGNHALPTDLKKGAIAELAKRWLLKPNSNHELIIDNDLDAERAMRKYVIMATQAEGVSLDFCIGQVIRHLQPIMYEEFAHCALPDKVKSEIIQLDERMKRYTYGPPVDSIQQQLALIDTGILKLHVVDDPDIEFDENGWYFQQGSDMQKATVMINTVLDAPVLTRINTPLIQRLRAKGFMTPITDDLGARIHRDGRLVNDNDNFLNISAGGRLVKGAILGTDAILECFSPALHHWAKGVINRCRQGKKRNDLYHLTDDAQINSFLSSLPA